MPADLRSRIYLEAGYGERFGVSDEQLAELVAGVRTHRQLVEECDVILQPKPLHADVAELREGQVLWGWPHCVQDEELTQLAIDRGLTLIAFEAMNHWKRDGSFGLHVFHKNNELAGYCSVLHALQLAGVDRRLRSPAARRRHRLRVDGPRGGHGARPPSASVTSTCSPTARWPRSPRRSTRPASCTSTATTRRRP